MTKYLENETPEFLEYMRKAKLFRRLFKVSAVLMFVYGFFVWFSIRVNGFRIAIPWEIALVGIFISGLLATFFLKKYYQVRGCKE